MIRQEMEDELQRLARGFGVTLIKVKIDAYWRRFAYCPLADFKQAVDDALINPMFPTGKGIADLIDRAMRDRRRRENAARDTGAKKLFIGERSALTPLGSFYGQAIPKVFREAAPGHFAEMMADLMARWCAQDNSRDQYLPEAIYWANMAALPITERHTAMMKELHYDCGDEYVNV